MELAQNCVLKFSSLGATQDVEFGVKLTCESVRKFLNFDFTGFSPHFKSSLLFNEANPSADTDFNIPTASFSRRRLQYSYRILQHTQTSMFLPYPSADTEFNIPTASFSRCRLQCSYRILRQT